MTGRYKQSLVRSGWANPQEGTLRVLLGQHRGQRGGDMAKSTQRDTKVSSTCCWATGQEHIPNEGSSREKYRNSTNWKRIRCYDGGKMKPRVGDEAGGRRSPGEHSRQHLARGRSPPAPRHRSRCWRLRRSSRAWSSPAWQGCQHPRPSCSPWAAAARRPWPGRSGRSCARRCSPTPATGER